MGGAHTCPLLLRSAPLVSSAPFFLASCPPSELLTSVSSSLFSLLPRLAVAVWGFSLLFPRWCLIGGDFLLPGSQGRVPLSCATVLCAACCGAVAPSAGSAVSSRCQGRVSGCSGWATGTDCGDSVLGDPQLPCTPLPFPTSGQGLFSELPVPILPLEGPFRPCPGPFLSCAPMLTHAGSQVSLGWLSALVAPAVSPSFFARWPHLGGGGSCSGLLTPASCSHLKSGVPLHAGVWRGLRTSLSSVLGAGGGWWPVHGCHCFS